MCAHRESAALAERLIAETIAKQGVASRGLGVHADRGSSMTSKPLALLLADLGVTKTYSRPHVSNDNPYSEAQFKTLKYRPGDRGRPRLLPHVLSLYNAQHRHSGLGLMTPAAVHYGEAEAIRARRAQVLDAAYARHPERFIRKPPEPPPLPSAAWINRPPAVHDEADSAITDALVSHRA